MAGFPRSDHKYHARINKWLYGNYKLYAPTQAFDNHYNIIIHAHAEINYYYCHPHNAMQCYYYTHTTQEPQCNTAQSHVTEVKHRLKQSVHPVRGKKITK